MTDRTICRHLRADPGATRRHIQMGDWTHVCCLACFNAAQAMTRSIYDYVRLYGTTTEGAGRADRG